MVAVAKKNAQQKHSVRQTYIWRFRSLAGPDAGREVEVTGEHWHATRQAVARQLACAEQDLATEVVSREPLAPVGLTRNEEAAMHGQKAHGT